MVIDVVLTYVEGHGGIEQLVTKIAQNLNKRGHQVRIFFAYFPEHIEWLGSLPEKHFFGLKLLQKKNQVNIKEFAAGYVEKLREVGLPAICIGIEPFICAVCYEALYQEIGVQIPIISWLTNRITTYQNPTDLKYATGHFTSSYFMKQDIREHAIHSPIDYVGAPVSIQGVPYIERPDKRLELVYVGRLVNKQKHIDELIKQLAKIEKEWQLTIIGDGEDRGVLELLSMELHIEDKIIWKSWQKQPWQSVEKASLLLLADEETVFSLAGLEALVRGIPVLAIYNKGLEEIIHSGENGWLVDKKSDEDFIEYIDAIIEGRLSLPDSKVCRESVKQYEEEMVCDQLERLLYEARARLTWAQLYEHMEHLWMKPF